MSQSVFLVYDWDSMASNWGEEYLEGTYATREAAQARADALNTQARISWMATCSPAGRANYTDRAHVVEQILKG